MVTKQSPSPVEEVPMSPLQHLRVKYRTVTPTDIFQVFDMEKASYHPEEKASKNDLQYRQHHAAPFFRCAVLEQDEIEGNDEDVIIGFICSTRSEPMEDDTILTSHQSSATSLTIHSVVVKEEYRRQGLGTDMLKNYVAALREFNATAENPISKVLLYSKAHLLTFCINGGFSVMRPSARVEGKDQRYYLELQLQSSSMAARKDPTKLLDMVGRECYVVDSFAAAPGTGNPAAVVMLAQDDDIESLSKWMQTVAAEFNLSETAFCWPRNQTELLSKELHWNIRYFSPKVEVPLCGHATLACAAVLYQTLQHKSDSRIVFHASEDDLTMQLAEPSIEDSPLRTRISMEFPAKPPQELTTREDQSAVRMMLEAAFSCALEPLYVGISDIGDVLIELTPEAFQDIGYEKLNFKALLEWDGYYRGVIVCCIYEEGSNGENNSSSPDFLSRFFGPKAGINEDPVTGSAHCVLGPYFSKKFGKEKVIGKQTSERGGIVECMVTPDKVRLTGTAVTTMSGTLWL